MLQEYTTEKYANVKNIESALSKHCLSLKKKRQDYKDFRLKQSLN